MQKLLALSQNGGLVAPYAGTICSVEYEDKDDDEVVTTTTTTTSAASASSYSAFFGMSSASADTSAATTTTTSTAVDTDKIKICTICPDLTMEIDLSVDESHILALEEGQDAEVTISSISEDEVFNGKVTEISRSASTSSTGVTKYTATVTIDKTPKMLAGMSASVYVRITGKDGALIIPIDALHQTSSTSFVYTSYDNELHEFGGMVQVTTGLSNSSYAEIESGLKEGDTVWYVDNSNNIFAYMMSGGRHSDRGGGMPSENHGGNFSGPPSGGMPGRG